MLETNSPPGDRLVRSVRTNVIYIECPNCYYRNPHDTLICHSCQAGTITPVGDEQWNSLVREQVDVAIEYSTRVSALHWHENKTYRGIRGDLGWTRRWWSSKR